MPTWTEPTLRSARWGTYRTRYGAGVTLIALGIFGTVLTSTYSLWFLLAGPVLHGSGWLVLPGALWRRTLVLLPCLLGGLALLAGPHFAGGFALLVAAWLFVRHRPARSYLAVLLPIAAAVLFKETLHDYSQNWVMLAGGTVTAVAAAWLGRWLATIRPLPSESVDKLR